MDEDTEGLQGSEVWGNDNNLQCKEGKACKNGE